MNDRQGSLTYQVIGALHAVETRLEEALEPLGLSLAKFGVLCQLVAAREPLPLRTLAERCCVALHQTGRLVPGSCGGAGHNRCCERF